ncbi:MAG: FKBP-type peptidyl-prolyl cis-trans isomerase [Sediminibacterium sp.]|uniref:FKBP-type peptidyl-prolyl cis-trans isomerase n=1 Tax=Sediminibacterium sp. TaxID=1917865 RepID=UPI002AB912D9|nr:FKBP-type peptidyl-prolyl cis-trans isomerase [Sediminibacterium sp.]MDZ4071124.1 FKBP-type peptidyl-prolyl cis-trans isomerase [Sediminibacterium sp.]
MKTLLLFVLSAVMSVSLLAQTKTPAQIAKEKADADTLQYALGVYMVKSLQKNGVIITNPTMFQKAVDDVLAKKKLMISEASAESKINNFQNAINSEKGLLMEQMLFAELNKQSGVVRMPSGVNYAVITKGTGRNPEPEDTVVINIVGKLPDGTVFIDSDKNKESFLILVKDLVLGLQDAVLRMKEGSVWRVFIPATLGFGASGNGSSVPPYTPLIYDIGLISVRSAKAK